MMIDRRTVLAAVGGLVMLGSGTGLAQSPQDWDKVIAGAKAEGKVVVYSAYVGPAHFKSIARAFEAKYGIPVEALEVRGSELRERIRAEQAANRFAADVIYSSESQIRLQERDEKVIAPRPVVPNLARLSARFNYPSPAAPTMIIPYGILINTGLVKPEEEPKRWTDLTDPRWKGKILADDTRAIGGGYLWFFASYEKLGPEFHEKMAAQDVKMTRDQRESQRRTARGEFAIYIPFILPDIFSLKGLPVKMIIPEEGVSYILYGNALLRNAPHPNAALLYIDFWLSEEAQLLIARDGHGVTIDGVAEKIPPDVKEIVGAKLMGTTDASRQNEMMAVAKKIYK
jgi:iron(III) transport system substrate-binding protein